MIGDAVRLLRGRALTVLTGAGCSTESGIPDYRGPSGSLKKRRPVQYLEFKNSPAVRQRYWARSVVGWRTFARAAPNDAHRAIARLELAGQVGGLVTQNVDGLHRAAGSARGVELHGSLHRVMCLSCGERTSRDAMQARLIEANPACEHWGAELAPDGDAELSPEMVQDFIVPACLRCGGILKPDVVFFGENVPQPVVSAAWEEVERGDVLLVVGSSLAVYSGYRFVKGAHERGRPVVILNRGPTRADELATLRIDAPAGETLRELATRLVEAHS